MEAGFESQIIALIVVAVFVAITAQRFRIPYTIAMVLTGLGVSLLGIGPALNLVELNPHLILVTFLPGLLFEAAYHLDLKELRNNLRTILILAVPGVLLSMVIIGFALHFILDLPLADAMLFGILISATDPIAVIALFKELGVTKRLSMLVEGESLFNDGVAIVLFGILSLVATGQQSFSLSQSIVDFFVTVAGGAALGLVAGLVFAELMRRTEDHVLDIALTAILAYGTYLLAEEVLHISPVIAVVVAAVYVGNFGAEGGVSATSQVTIVTFWEFAVFLINSAIFLLIGFQIEPASLVQNIWPVLIAIGVVLVARALVVYPLRYFVNWRIRKLPSKWGHVLFWGGLRGAVSMALALSIPSALASRELLELMAFGYVLFSLVLQGLTIRPLLRWLGMTRSSELEREFELHRARMAMAHAASHALEDMHNEHVLSGPLSDQLQEIYHSQVEEEWRKIERLLAVEPSLGEANVRYVQREIAQQQKQALLRLVRRGILSEEIYAELSAEIDEQEARLVSGDWQPRSILTRGAEAYLPDELDTKEMLDTSNLDDLLTRMKEEEPESPPA